MEITLEKVDQVRERTGVTYAEAKAALVQTEGDVLDAIILLEDQKENKAECDCEGKKQVAETIEELKAWLKDIINKGNVSRIKVSKDDKVIVDVPVNAGIAAGVIACIIPPILAFVVVAAVVTKVTIEITKTDGSVEVVNKYVTKTANDVKEKATDMAEKVKEKFSDININNVKKDTSYDKKDEVDESVFTYTVNFDDDDKDTEE